MLYYDGDCGFCILVVRVLSTLDLLHRVSWTPYQALDEPPAGLSWTDLERSAYLDTGWGTYREGFYAFQALTIQLAPLLPLAPIVWFPGIHRPGEALYRWVAGNRCRLTRCGMTPPVSRRPGS